MHRILLPSLVLLAACHNSASVNAGPSAARDVAVPGSPHALSLDGSDDVEVVRGAYAIHASGPQAILDRLTFETRDGVLHIGRKPGISFNTSDDVTIRVTMPTIDAAAVSGSGSVAVDRVEGKQFAGVIHGSGDLDIKDVAVDALAIDVSGSGETTATGRAKAINVLVSGSGDIDLAGVTSDTATVSSRGSSDVKLGATQKVTGSVSGSGDVEVAGHPTCTVDKSGSGEVTCG